MGTTWSVRLDNPAMLPRDTIQAAIEAALELVVAQMSTWEPSSSITRFNQAAAGSRHVLEREFAQVLACALHWAAASDGAIDPTVGPLVALWGFGAQASALPRMPTAAEAEAARARVGWQRLAFDGATRTLAQPGGVVLDLSGVAKGFAVDQVADSLQALGLRDFLVEVGGELRGAGRRPRGEPWQVAVEAGAQTVRIGLPDMSIATSGDRWHVRERDGRRWSHTIDPRSGEPLSHSLASVSVLHPRCADADALATLLTVLGPAQGLAFAQRHEIAALFVQHAATGPLQRASSGWTEHVRTP